MKMPDYEKKKMVKLSVFSSLRAGDTEALIR